MKDVFRGIKLFSKRMTEDHMGAYSATCAYFLMISFVPFIMIFLAIARKTSTDMTNVMNAMISIVPSGLKDYVSTIINEVYMKSYSILPFSLLILIWSAAKAFHAMTNGLNVISKVKETRGWFYLRFRSMMYVVVFLVLVVAAMYMQMSGKKINIMIASKFPVVASFLSFIYRFRSILTFIAFMLIFLFVYKFLPNCRYTFRSQLPGALIVTTVWMFFSYLLSIYYLNSKSFLTIYGSLTGIILAMIWLYFCMYFVLVGAEINRVIFEDPENNVIVNTVEGFKEASAKKREKLQAKIDAETKEAEEKADRANEIPSAQPEDIEINWENEKPGRTDDAEISRENEKPEKTDDAEISRGNEKPEKTDDAEISRENEKPEKTDEAEIKPGE